MKKLLIVLVTFLIVFGGLSLVLRNSPINPDASFYFLKTTGEWLDVNFLTFEAPAKQVKHLELSERRLDEFLILSAGNRGVKYASRLNRAYERELASAEFLAEQLVLLNPKYIPGVAMVYAMTLEQSRRLWNAAGDQSAIERFAVSAQIYNSRAIKTLLQKHWNSDADRKLYQSMVGEKIAAVKAALQYPTAEQQTQIARAEQVLSEGKELEWAYDIISSVR